MEDQYVLKFWREPEEGVMYLNNAFKLDVLDSNYDPVYQLDYIQFGLGMMRNKHCARKLSKKTAMRVDNYLRTNGLHCVAELYTEELWERWELIEI